MEDTKRKQEMDKRIVIYMNGKYWGRAKEVIIKKPIMKGKKIILPQRINIQL